MVLGYNALFFLITTLILSQRVTIATADKIVGPNGVRFRGVPLYAYKKLIAML